MFDVIMMFDKFFAQIIPKLAIGWRVACAQIIHWFNEAHPKVMLPEPIDHRPTETGIFGIDHPIRQQLSWIFASLVIDRTAVEWLRCHRLLCPGLGDSWHFRAHFLELAFHVCETLLLLYH